MSTCLPKISSSRAVRASWSMAQLRRRSRGLSPVSCQVMTRRPRATVEAEIATITRNTWVRRVITWQLTGDRPRDLRLSWAIDHDARTALEEEIFGKHVLITAHDARTALEEEIFGKHVLITAHDDWPV